jgi:uncharacterized protein (TIGR02147 family)
MHLFQFTDYKECLRALIDEKGERGYQSLLAEKAGCQRAFLSQVLNSHVHLTLDHAASLCKFWQFSELETDFFMELVNLDRAGSEALRSLARRRLKELRRQESSLKRKFNRTSTSNEEVHTRYYSNWQWAAVHVVTSIPGFQTSEAVAKRLGLPRSTVDMILLGLHEMGIVSKSSQGLWRPQRSDLFLERDSVMNFTNHWNWRQKALEDIQNVNEDSIHYTALHALSERDVEKFKALLLDFIETTRALVTPSPEEDFIAFTCDFFRP